MKKAAIASLGDDRETQILCTRLRITFLLQLNLVLLCFLVRRFSSIGALRKDMHRSLDLDAQLGTEGLKELSDINGLFKMQLFLRKCKMHVLNLRDEGVQAETPRGSS